MAAIDLSELAEIGQVVAGVASLLVGISVFLVWLQVKQQARDSRTELITGMTTLIVSVSQVFIEYPQMRKYFHADETPPAGEEKERAQAIAVTVADAMDHVAAHLDLMDGPTQAAWDSYFTGIYNKSPVLKEYLKDHKSWYGPQLHKRLGLG